MGSFITPNKKQEEPPKAEPPTPMIIPTIHQTRKLSKREIFFVCMVVCVIFVIPTIQQYIIYKLNVNKTNIVNMNSYDVIHDEIRQLDESTYSIHLDKKYIAYTNTLYSNDLHKQFLLNIIKNKQ